MKCILKWTGIVTLSVFAVAACSSANKTEPISSPVAASAPTKAAAPSVAVVPTAAATSAPAASTWKEVVKFEGESIKDTETFAINSNEWRILWETRPGKVGAMNFQIYIYNADTKAPVGVAANVIGEGKDSSVMRGKGNYYLTINTAQPYKIVIEAKE